MLKNLLTIGTLTAVLSFSATGHSQALPTATASGALQVGAGWTYANGDYTPQKIQGITAFADVDLTQHIGVEAEYHYLSLITPGDLGENSILAGPRFVLHRNRYSLYAKVLAGKGTLALQEPSRHPEAGAGSYFAYAAGIGIDYPIVRHLVVRGEAEYQHWSYGNGLTPLMATVGFAYRFR